MNLEDCFEEGAMFPSTKEHAEYLGFPCYEYTTEQYNEELFEIVKVKHTILLDKTRY